MRVLLPCLALALLTWPSAIEATDSPRFRGPEGDGRYLDTGLLKSWPESGPKELWYAEGLGQGYASVTVADGRIFTTGMAGEERSASVFAFDLDGKQLWKTTYGKAHAGGGFPGTRTTPTVAGGKLFLVSSSGNALALDAASGKILWDVNLTERFGAEMIYFGLSESPLVDGDRVIVTAGGKDASVVALSAADGSTVWTSKGLSDKSAYCSPRILEADGLRQIVTLVEKHLVGLDPETGKVLWKHRSEVSYDIHAVSPVFSGRKIYISHGYGQGGTMFELAADGGSVRELWKEAKMDVHHGGAVVVDGHIYGAASKKTWYALDLSSGEIVSTIARLGKGAIVEAEGLLYGYTEDGDVLLVNPDPKSFEVISSFEITRGKDQHWAHPVVSGGRLYIRHGDALMAFDVSAASAAPAAAAGAP